VADGGHLRRPGFAELGLACRRVAFVARFADQVPGRYRLVEVDPRAGELTPSAVLASDPPRNTRVTPAPVKVGEFNALSDKETHAFEGGAW
jgi:hypothetical protein